MNKTETARLLAIISTYDNRKVTPESVEAWFFAVGDLDFADVSKAVVMHRRESSEYLMPYHVRQNVKRLGDQRSREERVAVGGMLPVIEAPVDLSYPSCPHEQLVAKCLPCCKELALRHLLTGIAIPTGGGQVNLPTPTVSDTFTDNLASTQQKDGSMHSVTLPQVVKTLGGTNG